MNTKELQIGDWVNYRGTNIQVTSLYDKGGSNEIGWGVKESTWVNGRCIEPIPLTAEILEKNGFKRGFGEEGQPIFSTIQFGEYGMWDGYCFPNCKGRVLQYVHQLQHALRLCGIEKEFVI